MRAVATKSLVVWPRACWSEGCFFDHWRSGTTFSLATGSTTRRAVRKHRAPKGALRQIRRTLSASCSRSQKAPSAKRCIKTTRNGVLAEHFFVVRKHRAPKGALRRDRQGSLTIFQTMRQEAPSAKRCIKTGWRPPSSRDRRCYVRKHRAPNGALRLSLIGYGDPSDAHSQKAPSAKRCIKTVR